MAVSLPPRAYESIADALRESIRSRRLEAGTVLLEGGIAEMFGSSRTPVRQALDLLLEEGKVSRFPGRGVIVGDGTAAPARRKLEREDLATPADMPAKIWAWQTVYHAVERELIRASVQGCFRINEVEMARHHGIGRTVGHDVLIRIQATGILAKDRQAHWITVPLDDRRVRDLYALRGMLEPMVLAAAAPHIPADILSDMRTRLRAAIRAYPRVDSGQLDRLERDLHVACPSHAHNPELLAALARTRCLIIASKHILHHAEALPPSDPFLRQHDRVLAALQRGDGEAAAQALSTHLAAAQEKVSRRLRQFRKTLPLAMPPYIGPTKPFTADPASPDLLF
jgi:DNA-binding GntR family transcriptional regulator